MAIEIPDSFDPEWQAKMLRRLAANLSELKSYDGDSIVSLIEGCEEIVEAIREYSGY